MKNKQRKEREREREREREKERKKERKREREKESERERVSERRAIPTGRCCFALLARFAGSRCCSRCRGRGRAHLGVLVGINDEVERVKRHHVFGEQQRQIRLLNAIPCHTMPCGCDANHMSDAKEGGREGRGA